MIDVLQNVAIALMAISLVFNAVTIRWLNMSIKNLLQVAEIQSERIGLIER